MSMSAVEMEIEDSRKRHEVMTYRRTVVLAAFDHGAAIVIHCAAGRRVMVIRSGEMSTPEEGAERATYFGTDGPIGHIVRRSLGELVAAIDEDWCASYARVLNEAEIAAWIATDEFQEGSRRVAEVQAWNSGQR